MITSWHDERKRGGDNGDDDDNDDDNNNDKVAAAAAEGQRWRQRWRGVGQAAWCGAGVRWPKRRKW